MIINLSNHPSDKWNKKQLDAAIKKYGVVVDIPFPKISPTATTACIKKKATQYCNKITRMRLKSKNKNFAVHLMGEYTFTFHLVNMLKKKKIKVIASTTRRMVEEKNGKQIVIFDFVRFREY